jgi:RNA polymerase sigma-70 factor (ECF subfamily)
MNRPPSPPSGPELPGSTTSPSGSAGPAGPAGPQGPPGPHVAAGPGPAEAPSEVHQELGPLVDHLRPNLCRILGGFGIPAHEADDILQEVFLAAITKWTSIQNKEAWMVGALRNRCAAYWRRRRTDVLEAVDEAILDLLSQPQPAPQERALLVWDLENAFETLPPRHRAVLWLRFGLGLSSDEVAGQLGYSPASIRKLIARSLDRLRGAISASLPAGGRLAPPPSLPPPAPT